MHKSSFDRMKLFVDEYLSKFRGRPLKILDVGSCDVSSGQELPEWNRSYRSLFNDDAWSYVGSDIGPGNNVDVVIEDIYNWREFDDSEFDVVVSGQAFEHIEYIWQSMREVGRVLKPRGVCCIIAPSAGPEHKYPLDCWRIYPDGMVALAKYAGLEVVSAETNWDCSGYSDGSDDWKDTALIARRPELNSDLEYRLKNHQLVFSSYKGLLGILCAVVKRMWIRVMIKEVRQSGQFDVDFYLEKNPDVKESGVDPLRHYVLFGASEGRLHKRG